MAQTVWWLVDRDSARCRVDTGGVLVGRSARCDFVLRDPKASRSQAIVYANANGDRPKLLVLGKGRMTVNGVPAERETTLDEGDRIAVPGMELHVESSAAAPEHDNEGWVLDRPGGGLVGLSHAPFTIGGHAADDLHIEGWLDHALTLHFAQGRLLLTTQVPLEVDGVAVETGGMVALSPGSRMVLAGQSLRVIGGGDFGTGSTVLTGQGADAVHPDRVELEFLPRGGRLRVHAASKQYGVYLPGQRCDLMALLLQPPEPHRPGDILEDDLVISRVWPSQPRTRLDLNTLIYRLRRDLVSAGIDATTFVVRAAGGGGTKFGLAKDVDIRVA
jgi:hypothetical protein